MKNGLNPSSNIGPHRGDGRLAKRAGVAFIAVALCLAASGCSLFGSNKAKPAPLTEFKNDAITVAWSTSVGRSPVGIVRSFLFGKPVSYAFSPAFADKLIYVTSREGSVAALSEEVGRQVSQIDTKASLTGGVGLGDNIVTVASNKGEVLAFDFAGRALWKSDVSGEVLAAPVMVGTNLIVRTADGRIFALNRTDGKRKWVFTRATPALTLRTSASVASKRGTIYAGYAGGKVIAIESESGKPTWEATIATPRGATELERVADVAGVPALDDSRICAAVYQGRTGCVETLNGNVLWSREISSADGVALDAKYLYVSDTDGNLYALDKTSGATVWKQDKLQRRELGTPLSFKGKVLVGDATGLVHLISTENGELIGRVSTDGSDVVSLQAHGDRAFVQTAKGGVFALSIK